MSVTLMFQSTRPHGARPQHPDSFIAPILVSIHAPARGATLAELQPERWMPVSIHAPARGATADDARIRGLACVSIHAPARGATFSYIQLHYCFDVSIHAPARGATPSAQRGGARSSGFNPRARTGRDVTGKSWPQRG